METLQDRLLAAREAAGFSQGYVAKMVGISQPTYSELETKPGKGSKHIVKIASVLNVNPDWLAYGRGPRHSGLDPVEQELCALYRRLDESQQKLILTMLRSTAGEAP